MVTDRMLESAIDFAMADSSPNLIVIAGPNGGGKSTAAPALIREHVGIVQYVNADVIAQGLAGFCPESVALQAGSLMLERIEDLAASRQDFAIETTLASRSFVPRIRRMNESGYRSHLIFLWLPSPDMAVERVSLRVARGGHSIPPDTIVRRYHRGLSNLPLYFPLMHTWRVVNGASKNLALIAAHESGQTRIVQPELWASIEQYGHG
jgi:predicted ABC-type ATPase